MLDEAGGEEEECEEEEEELCVRGGMFPEVKAGIEGGVREADVIGEVEDAMQEECSGGRGEGGA